MAGTVLSPLRVHGGGAGVLRGVVGRRGDGRDKLIKVQRLVQDGPVRGHAVHIQGPRSVWHELEQQTNLRSVSAKCVR